MGTNGQRLPGVRAELEREIPRQLRHQRSFCCPRVRTSLLTMPDEYLAKLRFWPFPRVVSPRVPAGASLPPCGCGVRDLKPLQAPFGHETVNPYRVAVRSIDILSPHKVHRPARAALEKRRDCVLN